MDWFKIQPKSFMLVYKEVLMKPFFSKRTLHENHTNSICRGTVQHHLPHYLEDPHSWTIPSTVYKTAQFFLHDCNLPIFFHCSLSPWLLKLFQESMRPLKMMTAANRSLQQPKVNWVQGSHIHTPIWQEVRSNTGSPFGRVLPSHISLC